MTCIFRIICLAGIIFLNTNGLHAQELQPGDIAPDAIKLEVDGMSSFYGRFAVIEKKGAEALINDKGSVVIPFNTYRFKWTMDPYNLIGYTFYPERYFGTMRKYRKNISYEKLIPFVEIKTEKSGYMNMEGKSFYRMKKPEEIAYKDNPQWLGMFDEEGFKNHFSYYNGLLSGDNGVLVSEKYDGTLITGKGNYLKIKNKDTPVRVNYHLADYSWASANHSVPALSSASGWTNGLRPATYIPNKAQELQMNSADPLVQMNYNNTRVGFINRKGEFQIKPAYYSVSEFSEGISFVSKIDQFKQLQWGAIDTTGKMVIPYKFRLHPGRFNHGLAIIKAVDVPKIAYAFINKQGDIVFTIPKDSGDTASVSLSGVNDSNENMYTFDYFYFMEGYQFATINLKRPRGEQKYFTCLLDTAGRYIPIEQLISEKLMPGGTVKIYPEIVDGQFLFRFQRALYATGKQDKAGEFDALGIADVRGNIIIPPKFYRLSLFHKESNLQYAQLGKSPNYSDIGVEGYIDRQGVFRIIKIKGTGGF